MEPRGAGTRRSRLVTALAYAWALPNSLLGAVFILVALSSRGRVRIVDGAVEVHARAIAWLLRHATPWVGGACALTLGHVVVARDAASLCASRDHERAHVRQYERWGPLFLPAYFAASLAALLRGRDPYFDNCFEREARRAEALARAAGGTPARTQA